MSNRASGRGGVISALVGSLLAHAVVMSLVVYVPALTRPTRVQIPPRQEPIVVEVFLDAEGFEPEPEPEPEPPSPEDTAQADTAEALPTEPQPEPQTLKSEPKAEPAKRAPAPAKAPAPVKTPPATPPPEPTPASPTQPKTPPEEPKHPSGETVAVATPSTLSGTTDSQGDPEATGKGGGTTSSSSGSDIGSGDGLSKPTKPASTQTVASWTSALGQRVQKGLPYPPSAEEDGAEGTVTLSISVSADGTLLDVSVAKSSGDKRLDEAAMRRIRQLAPFSAPPEGALVFRLPIVFKLPS